MECSWHIRGGRIVDPAQNRDEIADLFIKDGLIVSSIPAPSPNLQVLDAGGLVVTPGLIDIHVHLRQPGKEGAETVESGCRAAASGGITTLVAMPNTTPATDSPHTVAATKERGDQAGLCTVLVSGTITQGRLGHELAHLAAMAEAGVVAFTDDGSCVGEPIMQAAMLEAARLGIPIMDHALDPKLSQQGVMHQGTVSKMLDIPGITSEAETMIVKRDIRLSRNTGCHIHIQHISAQESVEAIRTAQQQGVKVSAEATPHHLSLTDEDINGQDANFKMSPPLRTARDRAALLQGVADGTISSLATDHAPHTSQEKAKSFKDAPFGIVGLETAIGVTYTHLVKSGIMSLSDWIARWTRGPSQVLGHSTPTLAPGEPADVTLMDLRKEWTVNACGMVSKSHNTPFNGCVLTGQALSTFHHGHRVWHRRI